MIKKLTTLQAGKVYTVRNNGSTYTIIMGDISESASSASSSLSSSTSMLRTGTGNPPNSLGSFGDVFVDVLNKKVFTRDSVGWDSGMSLGGGSADSPFQVGTGSPAASLSSSISAYVDVQSMTFHTRSNGSWDEGRLMRGNAGSNGQSGKSVRFGSGPPLASLGEDDETYIDLNDFKIHTKSAGSWSSGSAFKGTNGQNGINGKSVKFGNGLPSDSDGEDDEVYLDLSNFKIHSKSAGTWGSGHQFKGADGQNGTSGTPGSDGKNGTDGTNGKKVVASSSITASGSPVGATSYGCDVGDTLIDSVNHKIYTRTNSSTWTLNGSSFKGATGSAGESSLIGQLTKEVAVIPANSKGNVTNENLSALGGGYFKVYSGKNDVTSACTFSISSLSAELAGSDYIDYIDNLQLNLNKTTGQFSLSGETWSADSTSFTLQATYSGSTVTKIYNVTKSKMGPGIRVYSVALGSDSSASDIELTSSYKDMYLSDVITNEGDILTAESSKSATTFTINESGRYKVELQAAFRIKNIVKSTTYATICSAQIIKGFTAPSATWSASTSALSATLGAVGTVAYSSSTVTISKTAFLAAGTTLKVQAKTSNASGGKSYLELADDTEIQSAEDTILTITKL